MYAYMRTSEAKGIRMYLETFAMTPVTEAARAVFRRNYGLCFLLAAVEYARTRTPIMRARPLQTLGIHPSRMNLLLTRSELCEPSVAPHPFSTRDQTNAETTFKAKTLNRGKESVHRLQGGSLSYPGQQLQLGVARETSPRAQ